MGIKRHHIKKDRCRVFTGNGTRDHVQLLYYPVFFPEKCHELVGMGAPSQCKEQHEKFIFNSADIHGVGAWHATWALYRSYACCLSKNALKKRGKPEPTIQLVQVLY